MVNILDNSVRISQGWVIVMLPVSTNILLYTLTPRFLMNIRELYALDVQARCDIDTGFGLLSRLGAGCGVGGTVTIGTIVFAEGGGIESLDQEQEIATAEREVDNGREGLEA